MDTNTAIRDIQCFCQGLVLDFWTRSIFWLKKYLLCKQLTFRMYPMFLYFCL
jgi:hypothetical protein